MQTTGEITEDTTNNSFSISFIEALNLHVVYEGSIKNIEDYELTDILNQNLNNKANFKNNNQSNSSMLDTRKITDFETLNNSIKKCEGLYFYKFF